MIEPLKLILTLYSPIVIICINHYVGIAIIKFIFNYPINNIISRFLISSAIRTILIVGTAVLIYDAGYVYGVPFFLWLFILFFIFKIVEILKINKMRH